MIALEDTLAEDPSLRTVAQVDVPSLLDDETPLGDDTDSPLSHLPTLQYTVAVVAAFSV